MAEELTKRQQLFLKEIREMKQRKDPVEVLKYLFLHWFDCQGPIGPVILCPYDDMEYTINKLVEDTLEAIEE